MRKVCTLTGEVLKSVTLPHRYFAEGLTIVDNSIYLLTWQERTLLIYDLLTLELKDIRAFKTVTGQGWGMAYDGKHLIVTDGSHYISKFDVPEEGSDKEMKAVQQIEVTDKGGNKIGHLNDIEYINGYFYCNVWYKDYILKIEPATGNVLEVYDLRKLYPPRKRIPSADCLNGIAYNKSDGSVLLTGKQWPKYYVVQLEDTEPEVERRNIVLNGADVNYSR